MKLRLFKLATLVAICLLIVGCTGKPKKGDGDGAPAPVDDSAQITGAKAGAEWKGDPLENPDSLLYTKTIYFDYDISEIRSDYRDVVIAHGEYLAANPSARVTVEGHCDERGSREYNIALGERRANAVRQLMTLMGASGQQIRTVSYGEERPVAEGHNESAWQLNRRVEIIYRTR